MSIIQELANSHNKLPALLNDIQRCNDTLKRASNVAEHSFLTAFGVALFTSIPVAIGVYVLMNLANMTWAKNYEKQKINKKHSHFSPELLELIKKHTINKKFDFSDHSFQPKDILVTQEMLQVVKISAAYLIQNEIETLASLPNVFPIEFWKTLQTVANNEKHKHQELAKIVQELPNLEPQKIRIESTINVSPVATDKQVTDDYQNNKTKNKLHSI